MMTQKQIRRLAVEIAHSPDALTSPEPGDTKRLADLWEQVLTTKHVEVAKVLRFGL